MFFYNYFPYPIEKQRRISIVCKPFFRNDTGNAVNALVCEVVGEDTSAALKDVYQASANFLIFLPRVLGLRA
jgi:hypothetical protein